jgi:Fic family protein
MNYVPPSPEKVSAQMKKFLTRLPAMRKKFHPVEFAARVHQGIVDIHPFVDGNGRTARLLMNLALVQAGYPLVIIPPMLRQFHFFYQAVANRHQGRVRVCEFCELHGV